MKEWIFIAFVSVLVLAAGCQTAESPKNDQNSTENTPVNDSLNESYEMDENETIESENQSESLQIPARVPDEVISKYEELIPTYNKSLGVTIKECVSSRIVYLVSGSGGFTGTTFYFDEKGNKLGSKSFTDIRIPDEEPEEPPINISKFNCSDIVESKAG